MSPPNAIFFKASHWSSDHMISLRPLIGKPYLPTYLAPPPFPRLPRIFLGFSRGFLGVCPGFSRGFPWVFRGFPRVCQGFSQGFPGVFMGFYQGFPRVSRGFPGFPGVFPGFSLDFSGVFRDYFFIYFFLIFFLVNSRNLFFSRNLLKILFVLLSASVKRFGVSRMRDFLHKQGFNQNNFTQKSEDEGGVSKRRLPHIFRGNTFMGRPSFTSFESYDFQMFGNKLNRIFCFFFKQQDKKNAQEQSIKVEYI